MSEDWVNGQKKKIKIKEELDTNKKFKKCCKRIHVLYIYVLRIIF